MFVKERDNGEIHILASAGSVASCVTLLGSLEKSQLKKVTMVDLSFNSLRSIDGLETLPNMKSLDIRCNNVPSLQTILPVLQRCHGLRHLRMKVCGRFAREPKMYLHEICKEVPALVTVDGLKSTCQLSDQQQRAQRFLNRVFGIGPNQIADVNLNGKEIYGEDFACVLRALSHLPVIRLQMQDNPAAQIRGYRCYVVSMVKSLKVLDGQPVTSDEKVNATREISKVSKEVNSVQLEVDRQRVIQQLLTKSPTSGETQQGKSNKDAAIGGTSYREVYQNSSFMIEEFRGSTSGGGGGGSRNPITSHQTPRHFDHQSSTLMMTPSSTVSPLEPRKLSFSNNSSIVPTSQQKQNRPPGTKRKINLMLVASKPLREDIVEFLEDEETGAPLVKNLDMPEIFKGLENAPIQAVAGRVWSKLEILLNYLQIYRLIFRFSIPWPAIWYSLNNESDVTSWLLQYVPSLIFQGEQKSDKSSLIIFMTFLFLPIILLGIYYAKIVDRIIPKKINKILLRLTGYSWGMLRKRAALFVMTVSYLPLANSMLSMVIPTTNSDAQLVIKGLPHTVWPTSISNFSLGVHWPMIVGFIGGFIYIIGIPFICTSLIKKGATEARTAHAVEEVRKQIFDLKQTLLEKESLAQCYEPEIRACILDRERAYDLLYSKAVREYHKAQTYLYEDYHEKAKYYKVLIMAWKIVMLVNVLGTGALAFTVSPKFVPVQTTCGLLLVGTMLITTSVKRPFQASSENMLEIALIGANLLNASIAFLLSIVAQARSDQILHDLFESDEISGNVTGGILIIVNALALFFAFGVIGVTPCLNRLSKKEIKRLKEFNIQHAVKQLQTQNSYDRNIHQTLRRNNIRASNSKDLNLTHRRRIKTPSVKKFAIEQVESFTSSQCTPGLNTNAFHQEIHAIAQVCNSIPINSQDSRTSKSSRGSMGNRSSTSKAYHSGASSKQTYTGGSSSSKKPGSSSKTKSSSIKRNKSIIHQLFDGDYASPFYRRLENLRNLTRLENNTSSAAGGGGGKEDDLHAPPNSAHRSANNKAKGLAYTSP